MDRRELVLAIVVWVVVLCMLLARPVHAEDRPTYCGGPGHAPVATNVRLECPGFTYHTAYPLGSPTPGPSPKPAAAGWPETGKGGMSASRG